MSSLRDGDIESVRSVYGRWGRHPRLYAAQDWVTFLGRPGRVRSGAVAAMDAGPGQRVLEIGCGTGRNFRYILDVIGPTGTLVGVDASSPMLAAARRISARNRWRNVRLMVGDASDLDPDLTGFDAVLAVLALSAFPDVPGALAGCHRALRPGGTLTVCDAGALRGGWRVLNPVVVPVYSRWAAWHPDRDLPGEIDAVFGNVTTQLLPGGAFFVCTAVKGGGC